MNELRWKMKYIDGHWHSVSCKGFLREIKEEGKNVIQAIRTLALSNIVETYHNMSFPTIAFFAVFHMLILSSFAGVYGSKFYWLDNNAYFAICPSGLLEAFGYNGKVGE